MTNATGSIVGVLGILSSAVLAFANKDKIPMICIFQVGNCGGNGNPNVTINPFSSTPPSYQPSPSNDVSSKEEYLGHIESAKLALAVMQPDAPIQFPMGVHSPIKSKNAKLNSSSLVVIGYFDQEARKVKPVTPSELLGLLNQPEYADFLYSQLAGNVTSDQRYLRAINLVVFDSKYQAVSTLDSVDASDFVRDAVNSKINGTLVASQYNRKLENLLVNR